MRPDASRSLRFASRVSFSVSASFGAIVSAACDTEPRSPMPLAMPNSRAFCDCCRRMSPGVV